jgi:glycosyltransferase involved in cell wall biosynthesis
MAVTNVDTLQIGITWFGEHAGGLERYYAELLRHLSQAGVAVHGLVVGSDQVARESGGLVRAFATPDVALPRRLWAVRRATRALLADRSLLVVSHFALHTLPIMDRLTHRPLVVHFHGPWGRESALEGASLCAVQAKQAVERFIYQRGTFVIALSRAAATLLHDSYGINSDRIRVIPGGVSSSSFLTEERAAARERLGWPANRPIVLVVRRLTRRMGLEDVIAAAVEIRRRIQEVLVLIGGSGPLASDLRSRISAAGLERSVQLLGFIPDPLLAFAYRAADITLIPSTALEIFGLVAIESLAAGTPVLVTPVGGLPETVERLSPQCVLPAAGERAVAEGVIAALDGSLRLPSSDECTRFARQYYHWSLVAPRVSKVYSEALQ